MPQLIKSIRERKQHKDTTGDPWNGRSLEWSIPSPAPTYNFAMLPVVQSRDEFWQMKQNIKPTLVKDTVYEDIVLPKNTSAGIVIAVFVFFFGFGVVWHILWLMGLGVVGAIVALLFRTFSDESCMERVVSAEKIAQTEAALRVGFATHI